LEPAIAAGYTDAHPILNVFSFSVPQFAMVVQATGTALLFFLYILLYQKLRRGGFLDWIWSWAFLLAALGIRIAMGSGVQIPDSLYFLLHVFLLTHVYFLLRGARRFREERGSASPFELIWVVPIIAVAWWTTAETTTVAARAAPIHLLLAAAYVAAAILFATASSSPAGRLLLTISFLLWGAERAAVGIAYLRFGDLESAPPLVHYSAFGAVFFEMTIAVGIIIFLFETSQSRLHAEVRQLQDDEERFQEQGVRDPLTGLYNRNHFNDVIRRETANVRRYGTPLSVLLADLDRFKQINDIQGHAAGDEVLKFVASYLTDQVRENDYVFRWGGDEFLILLPRTDEGSAAAKAVEIASGLPAIPGTGQIKPALSVGWATHRMDSDFPKILALADSRMYEMKLKGKKEHEERDRALRRL
jgi:diguanylate cyclase (GGDEF)-like protein